MYIHTYIHTYTHTYIHMYTHMYIHYNTSYKVPTEIKTSHYSLPIASHVHIQQDIPPSSSPRPDIRSLLGMGGLFCLAEAGIGSKAVMSHLKS